MKSFVSKSETPAPQPNGVSAPNEEACPGASAYSARHPSRRIDLARFFPLGIAALVALTIHLIVRRPDSVSLLNRGLALLIVWVGSFPTLHYLKSKTRPPIPFFPLVGLFYVTNFGLPMFVGEIQSAAGNTPFLIGSVTSEALLLTIAGLICLILGFQTGVRGIWRRVGAVSLASDYDAYCFRWILWALLLAHVTYRAMPFLRQVPSIGHILEPGGYLAFGLLFMSWLRGTLPKSQGIALVCFVLPFDLLLRLTSGSLGAVMLFVLFLGIISLSIRPSLTIAGGIAALLVFAFFNPVKEKYRAIVWYDESRNRDFADVIERTQLFAQLAFEHYFVSHPAHEETLSGGTATLVNRVATIAILSDVMDLTPSVVPYWGGVTYLQLLAMPIPRALWPGKPKEESGQAFGHRYEYLNAEDETTSLNIAWIVEMYANFGAIGVILGMFLAGIILSYLNQLFNQRGMNPIQFVFGATILLPLTYQESSFATMMGNIFLVSISLYLLIRFAGALDRGRR